MELENRGGGVSMERQEVQGLNPGVTGGNSEVWKPRGRKKHFQGGADNRSSKIRVNTNHRIQKIALPYIGFLVIGLGEK